MSKQTPISASARVVLFDFDYTLADSSVGIIESVNWALAKLGMSPRPEGAIRRTIGLSLTDTFAALTGERSTQAERFVALFIKRADEVMAEHTSLLPGAADAILALSQADYRLGVVSTKFRRRIETVLGRDGLRAPFEVIIGGEDVSQHKPDSACLLAASQALGIRPAEALYVGDSGVDGEAATRAGMGFVAVLSGATSEAGLRAWNPLAVLADVSALPAWMEGTHHDG